jgi:hypothetical protein
MSQSQMLEPNSKIRRGSIQVPLKSLGLHTYLMLVLAATPGLSSKFVGDMHGSL